MKYLPTQAFEAVTGALNFNTPDCSVTGGCDLYTTKSSRADKKLWKAIDRDLMSQYASLQRLGASLSPPQREAMMATSPDMKLFSQSSPFGAPLTEIHSRRTFAYLIATLNASHQHYDFSHVLRPADFKRERNLRQVMVNLDSILQTLRPHPETQPGDPVSSAVMDPAVWGPQCWAMIDKEMRLNRCAIFSYCPDDDPFDEDESASAIWSTHYFFFNRQLKRIAYLYIRVVPVVSSQWHAALRPMLPSRRSSSSAKRPHSENWDAMTANKRTRYWLGDRDADVVPPQDDDEIPNDGFVWNRGADGDLLSFLDEDYEADLYYDEDEDDDDDDDEDDDYDADRRKSIVRGMSEDLVGHMEI
ncbi:hypothetical protein ACRALDRAFT_2026423 [Sodiomyces alcalophilus JCM 7366]|uniref:uncharacterized protein n=1 Tax=Sodiomyces alcalophilus JCM 7366 TaxID=591952 RepID=UPI0039B6754C